MINFWAFATGILLLSLNSLIRFTGSLAIYGGANPFGYNLFYLFALTGGIFATLFGVFGGLVASYGTIVSLVYYTILRFRNEPFEWKIK